MHLGTDEYMSFGEMLIASLEKALAYKRGEPREGTRVVTRHTARTSRVAPPPRFKPEQIGAIRESLGLSQPVFAAAPNISPTTVQAWEQGLREPAGAARRLLQLAQCSPGRFADSMRAISGDAFPAAGPTRRHPLAATAAARR